jgi:hypothetical protein
VSPNKFGIHLTTLTGRFYVGDSDENLFKVSKALTVAWLFFWDERIWKE